MEHKRLPKLREILRQIAEEDRESEKIVLKFKNEPSDNTQRFLFVSESVLCEGKTKQLSGGYSTRYDKRPSEQGGDQLHVFGPHGQKWAYRCDGSRSEPHKYTLPTTNKLRGIVSQAFGIDKGQIQEMVIIHANNRRILIEVTFV